MRKLIQTAAMAQSEAATMLSLDAQKNLSLGTKIDFPHQPNPFRILQLTTNIRFRDRTLKMMIIL
jgi:hypothetical protein